MGRVGVTTGRRFRGIRRGPTGRFWACLLAVILACDLARAEFWYEAYDRAERELAAGNWNAAIAQLNAALEQKGDSSARARTYGMNFIPYFPYYKLGVAYFNLGQLEAAQRAFDTEERLGQIQQSAKDAAELERLRRSIADRQQTAIAEEQQKRLDLIARNLSEARTLEGQGKIEEAIAAVDRALAVDRDNADAKNLKSRLAGALSRAEETRRNEQRVADLLADGRRLLDGGRFEEAASILGQADGLRSTPESRSLLDQAQTRLREQVGARKSADERKQTVVRALDSAGSLERQGKFEEAMQTLQTVLALEPTNEVALRLRDRLQAAIMKGESAKEIDSLLADVQKRFDARQFEAALALANRALAIDPQNPQAMDYLTRSYRELNRALLAAGETVDLAPSIAWVDSRAEIQVASDQTLQVEVLDAPGRQLFGTIFDSEAPAVTARLLYFGDTPPTDLGNLEPVARRELEVRVGATAQGDFVVSTYVIQAFFDPGYSIVEVMAQTPSITVPSQYILRYDRPWFRSPWMFASLAVAALAAGGGVVASRVRRRNELLKRRFNPYIAGAPVLKDDIFFGREKLLHRILQTVHNNSILLHGERRIGKTSLQHHLARRLRALQDPEYDFYPVYIDLQGTPQDRFFAHLAEGVFEELAPILGGLKPDATLAAGTGYDHRELVRDLREVLRVLHEKSAKRPKLVLLIDEVDELNSYDPRINQRLRSLFMRSFAEDLRAVVSGVQIKKHWESEGSPWYNFFEEIEVKPFGRDDAEDLVRKPIRGIFKLEDGVVERIVALTDSRPYLIQKLCVALVNRLHDERRRTITVADVEAIGRPSEA